MMHFDITHDSTRQHDIYEQPDKKKRIWTTPHQTTSRHTFRAHNLKKHKKDKALTSCIGTTSETMIRQGQQQGRQQPRGFARCTVCMSIGGRDELCIKCKNNREETTKPRHTMEITTVYRHDLSDLEITREQNLYNGNCGACYRKGYQGQWCMDCNYEIITLSTEYGDNMDPYFVAAYYKQYDIETEIIPIDRMNRSDQQESDLDAIFAAFSSDTVETLSPTAATRGRNGLVPADVLNSESEDEEEPYGENVNENMEIDQMDDDAPVAMRRDYYDQPKPNFGSDEYILEVITQAGEVPDEDEDHEEDQQSDGNSNDEELHWSDEEQDEPSHPLDKNEFNETMYRRLKAMTIGKLSRYHRED